MLESQDNCSNSSRIMSKSKTMRCRSFHLRYLELCRSKNVAPLADLRKNNKDQVTLDFFGDKLSVTDWLIVTNALFSDQVLRTISVRLRKCLSPVISNMDTERKAKIFKQKPAIYTKFVFSEIIKSLSNCIEFNKNLLVLNLEGLPLSDSYAESIAKSLSSNTNIKQISFARSNLYDSGCEVICNTIKYLDNVEKLNISDTGLTSKGAECIADMIKIQKISRFTAGWQQSLRYRDFDASNIPGLREILLARNPQIGDSGLSSIVEVLKEDIWVKTIDMENCGLTDRAANILLDCLKSNKFLNEFNIRGNPGISKFLLRNINEHLNKENQPYQRSGEDLLRDFTDGLVNGDDLAKAPKLTIQQLITQLKATNEQLELERRVRKKAEQLNEKLTAQIMAYENKLGSVTDGIPEGYVVVKNESLQSIIRERNDLHKVAGNMQNDELSLPHYLPKSSRPKKQNFKQNQTNEVQFQTPLPEPSVSPSESARSNISQKKSSRQPGKVRKVKSEMKYEEQQNKVHSSNLKGTKSDYDYGTDTDVPQFETNVGDTLANTDAQQSKHIQQQTINRRSVHYSSNIQYVKNHDMDEISLSTSRSHGSDAASADSETLRRNEDSVFQQMKAAYKNSKSSPKEYGQGEGSGTKKQRRSPRSLFLGLCED